MSIARLKPRLSLAVIVATPVIVLLAFLLGAGPSTMGEVDLYALNRPASFTFITQDGQLVGHSGVTASERLKLSEMPAYLPAAFLTMEDRRFFEHGSTDISGLIRAAFQNADAGHAVAGGSTITQQTAKLLFLNSERTLSRKLQELATAWTLERKMTKEQILTLYLNRVYLGSGAYGVDAAAQTYFGKSAREVTLAEAAMLAALTRAPSVFSPRRDLPAALTRANVVLANMALAGAITLDQAVDARERPAILMQAAPDATHDYFFDAAASEARRVALNPTGDLIVVTTFNPKIQDDARSSLQEMLDTKGEVAQVDQAALVLMNTDGAVRAMVGGRDYALSQFNRVTQARRQPGSAFKAMVYLAALENGYTPQDSLNGRAVNVNGYRPQNYGGAHYGWVTLSDALARSINTVAVKLQQNVGVYNVIATARKLGIRSPLKANASLALGSSEVTPMELTGAYATFASGGLKVDPYMVLQIRTPSGTVIYQRPDTTQEQLIAPEHAQAMDRMLRGVVAWGTGHSASIPGHRVSGKTGTTSNYRDAWFVGYTDNLIAGVWMGNDEATAMNRITGGTLPAKLWRQVVIAALRDQPPDYTSAPKRAAPALPAPVTVTPPVTDDNGFDDQDDDGGKDLQPDTEYDAAMAAYSPNASGAARNERGVTAALNHRTLRLGGWTLR